MSGTEPSNEGEIPDFDINSSDKRNRSDLSIDSQDSSTPATKLVKVVDPSVNIRELIADIKTAVLEKFEFLEHDLEERLNQFTNSITSLEAKIETVEQAASSSDIVISNLSSRVEYLELHSDELTTRLAALEARSPPSDDLNNRLLALEARSSPDEDLTNRLAALESLSTSSDDLTNRIVALESRPAPNDDLILNRLTAIESTAGSTLPLGSWEPTGSPNIDILLIGDSNSANKLKFGSGIGTLGAALPGSDIFCATLEALPNTQDDIFTGKSDVVLAVGTNSLKVDNSNPVELAKCTHRYVQSLSRAHPSANVFLPGVLPVDKSMSDLNTKIKSYNFYLKDMCNSLPRVYFINTNVLMNKEGSLTEKLGCGPRDPLHLSAEGLRLYFSRIKYALRARHGLPLPRRRVQPVGGAAESGGRGGYTIRGGGGRGGSRGRGGPRGGGGGT